MAKILRNTALAVSTVALGVAAAAAVITTRPGGETRMQHYANRIEEAFVPPESPQVRACREAAAKLGNAHQSQATVDGKSCSIMATSVAADPRAAKIEACDRAITALKEGQDPSGMTDDATCRLSLS